jgi:glutaredoxin 2
MKNNDKKEEINKILEDKFKYTNDILSDKIQKVLNDTIEDVDYYNDKKEEIDKILEDKFKYTNEILSEKIEKLFDEKLDESSEYYDDKQKSRLLLFKYSLYSIPIFVVLALIYHYIFKV